MIQKINFRDQVREYLLNELRSGRLRLNDTLSLAELGRELQISVTPIREALSQLQHAKIIEAIPNRGFRIPPLDDWEALNLYTLLGTLEHMVISYATYDDHAIDRLISANDTFLASETALDRINADLNFHAELIAPSKNDYARQIIADIKTRIFFYEMNFMANKAIQPISNHHHHEIISALEAGDTQRAAATVKDNWLLTLSKYKELA